MKILAMMIIGAVLLIPAKTTAEAQNPKPVKSDAAKKWHRHLLPLPQKIKITGEKTLKPSEVLIRATGKDQMVKSAVANLRNFYQEKTGVAPEGKSFEIIIGIIAQDGKLAGIEIDDYRKLKTFPNPEQAYLIQPKENNKLLLAAISGKGIFYGVQTLKQLLGVQISKNSVTVPLVRIADWPDAAERGVWNGYMAPYIPWMSSMKLNFHNCKVYPKVKKSASEPEVTIDISPEKKKFLLASKGFPFKYNPQFSHFNFMTYTSGMYKAYPELKDTGPDAIQIHYRDYYVKQWGEAPRYPLTEKPLFKKILKKWLLELAEQGHMEPSVWTSEFRSKHLLKDKKAPVKKDRWTNEVKAIIDAWQEVKKQYPEFKVRVFLGFRNLALYPEFKKYDDMTDILALIPKELIIEKACNGPKTKHNADGTLTYYEEPFDSYAQNGYKLVSYRLPGISTKSFCFRPLLYQDFIRQLVKDRKWQGGYANISCNNPDLTKLYNGSNLAAIAEYSWNADGRSPQEFAEAWATINNYKKPDLFGEWAKLEAPLYMKVRGIYNYDLLTMRIKNYRKFLTRKYPFKRGPLTFFKSPEDIISALKQAENVIKLAEELAMPQWQAESLHLLSRLRSLQFLGNIGRCKNDEQRQQCLKNYEQAGKERIESIKITADWLPQSCRKAYNAESQIKSVKQTLAFVKEELKKVKK